MSISMTMGTPSIHATVQSRRGRVLIARGRDAADAAISNSFGPNILKEFKVWTDEASDEIINLLASGGQSASWLLRNHIQRPAS